jgi:nucleoid DNA-binding protein
MNKIRDFLTSFCIAIFSLLPGERLEIVTFGNIYYKVKERQSGKNPIVIYKQFPM